MSDDHPLPSSRFTLSLLPLALFFLLGCFSGGWGMHELHERQQSVGSEIAQDITQFRENSDEYTFIRPLLYCRLPESTVLGENEGLKKDIETLISSFTKANPGFEASVYYRDMNRGRWIGVNEDKEYTPASLLKVVIMITYFKEAETKPTILENTVTFTQAHADLLARAPLDRGTELTIDQTYTIDDLIRRMIVKSDNGATYALLANIETRSLNQVYRDLELKSPGEADDFTINAREYSYFLRILYNATYLERTLSERALSLLSQAEFREGLDKGVPSGILVSHKYGESISASGSSINSLELHDCGIIYQPEKPYVLCIMTRGQTLNPLLQAIQSISKKVYEDVKNEGG
jgi:beta-lactamase class A